MTESSLNHLKRGRQHSGVVLVEWSAETDFTFLPEKDFTFLPGSPLREHDSRGHIQGIFPSSESVKA